jgi:hypothetical protein
MLLSGYDTSLPMARALSVQIRSNVLARDVMVAEDRLRIQSLSPSSFDSRLRSAISPCRSVSSVVNTAFDSAEPSVQQPVAATAMRRMRLLRRAESMTC